MAAGCSAHLAGPWDAGERTAASIRRSASRSAAVAGGTPSSAAVGSTRAVVVEDLGRLGLGPLEREALAARRRPGSPRPRSRSSPARRGCPAAASSVLDAGVGQLVVGAAADQPGRQHPDDLVGRARRPARTASRRRGRRATSASVSSTTSTSGCACRTTSTAAAETSVTTTVAPSSTRWLDQVAADLADPGDADPSGRPGWARPTGARRRPACPGRRRTPSAPTSRRRRRCSGDRPVDEPGLPRHDVHVLRRRCRRRRP